MTIMLSALSRYHVFDLALQLQRHGLLNGLVSAYPRSHLGRYKLLSTQLVSLPQFAFGHKAVLALSRMLGAHAYVPFGEMLYRRFGGAVARAARRRDVAVVYGLSGFMLEAVDAELQGKITVVDHGSLHIETEKEILSAECRRFGFAEFGNWRHDWMVSRMRREFGHADYVVCCSELAKETMLRHGVAEHKLFVNRLGVNLGEFSRTAPRAPRVNRNLRVLFVGAITPLKGVHYLLDAFRGLPADTELWLVGAHATDPVLRRMIEKCAQATRRVRLIGPVQQNRLNEIYGQCDVFVLPSLSDGWGMVVSQAAACGLPIVVSDMTGAKELLRDGVNGLVARSRDAADLGAKLEVALHKCKSREWDSTRTHAGAMTGSTWQDYGDRWARWLQNISA